jgi:hypothetical protein
MAKIQDSGFRPPVPPGDKNVEGRKSPPTGRTGQAAPPQAAQFPDKVQEHAGQASILDHEPSAGPARQDAAGKAAADAPELAEDMTARLKMARLNPTVRSDASATAERITRELKSKPEPGRMEQLAQKALTHCAKASGAGKTEMQSHQMVLESARNQWEKVGQDEQSAAGSQSGKLEAAVFGELMAHFSKTPGTDPMATLFSVMKESIEETNRDKKYALEKLQSMNEIAEAMGDYLSELADQSEALQASTGEETSDDKVDIDVRFPRPPGPDDVLQISRLGPKERVAMNPIERDAHIGDVTRLKDELDDQTQILQFELQEKTNKAQQNLQAMSNVLKALTDTSQTLIKNIK